MQSPTITIKGKAYPLRWNLRAHYRLQGLASPSQVEHLTDTSRSVKAMLDFSWASLSADAPFAAPEDLADAMSDEANGLEQCSRALTAMFAAAADTPEKKTEQTSSPTPESNSA